jgi:hypothetical protein
VIDSLINLAFSIRCGVIAFEGSSQLFQTADAPCKQLKPSSSIVFVKFQKVTADGDIDDSETYTLSQIGYHDKRILAVNQNKHILDLQRHVHETDPSELLFPALKDYIGAGPPAWLTPKITCPPHSSFHELNDEQQRVAHPLSLRTAKEVAGPPGTGKTKTITAFLGRIYNALRMTLSFSLNEMLPLMPF